MNVLLFVMTMLMLLSLMTYARLDSYRSSQAFQLVFQHYMQEEERGYLNLQALKTYQKIKLSEKESKPKTKIDASPRIGIALLFDKDREGKSKEWGQTKILLTQLMHTLYDKQPFFQKLEQERPSFIEELIRGITQSLDLLPQEKIPKTAAGLANLTLNDPQLDQVLYKMLHGAFYKKIPEELLNHSSIKNEKNVELEAAGEEEGDMNEELEEYQSSEGYYSLLDFVTSTSTPKIRVFLASREVLQTVFPDSTTVNAIMEERQKLYQEAILDADMKALNQTFKTQFEKMKDPIIDETSLNFSVSKTNPKYYK